MRNFLSTFMTRYKANCETSYELDQSLMKDVSFEEWKEILQTRSIKVSKIYQQNERLLGEMREYLSEPLNFDRAWELYYGLWDLFNGGYDDLYLMRVMAKPLIEYYEEQKDYEKLVFLYHLLGFENFSFHERMLGGNEITESLDCFHMVLELRSHYWEIMDAKVRRCFFATYDSMLRLYLNIKEPSEMLNIYSEAMDFWHSSTVQELDRDTDTIREAIRMIRGDVLSAENYTTEMTREQQDLFRAVVRGVEKHGPVDQEGRLFRAQVRCRLLEGEDPKRLIEELIEHIREIPAPNYDNLETATFRLVDMHYTAIKIFDYFTYGEISEEEQKTYLKCFFDDVTEQHTHIPFEYWTEQMDNLCVEWYKEAAPYLPLGEKISLLKKLVIMHQPITYIHSIMVGEIASRIAESMVQRRPEYFIGIMDCENAEDVQKNAKKILEYVAEAAELHDIGKCELVKVVNRLNRHLSDVEFSILRKHPEISLEFLNNDPDFAPYYDVMLGHHKSCDGRQGYPETFDNTKSRVKCVIDIIMIADCTDAATDVLGRNYASGKDFDVLYKELKESAGTKYAPEVVELIGEDRKLYEELSWLTGDGRKDIHYRAYKDIVALS